MSEPAIITPETPLPVPALPSELPPTAILLTPWTPPAPPSYRKSRRPHPSLTGFNLVTDHATISASLAASGDDSENLYFPHYRALRTYFQNLLRPPTGTSFLLHTSPLYLITDSRSGLSRYLPTSPTSPTFSYYWRISPLNQMPIDHSEYEKLPRSTRPTYFYDLPKPDPKNYDAELLSPSQHPPTPYSLPQLVLYPHPVITSSNPDTIRDLVLRYGTCPLAHHITPPSSLNRLDSLRYPGGFVQVGRPPKSRRSSSRSPQTEVAQSAREKMLKRLTQGLLPLNSIQEDLNSSISLLPPYPRISTAHLYYLQDFTIIQKTIHDTLNLQATVLTSLLQYLHNLFAPLTSPFLSTHRHERFRFHDDPLSPHIGARLARRILTSPPLLDPIRLVLSHTYFLRVLLQQGRLSPTLHIEPPSPSPSPIPRPLRPLLHVLHALSIPWPTPPIPSASHSLCLHLISIRPHSHIVSQYQEGSRRVTSPSPRTPLIPDGLHPEE